MERLPQLSAAQKAILARSASPLGYEPQLRADNRDLPLWVGIPIVGAIIHQMAIRRLVALGLVEFRTREGFPVSDLYATEKGRQVLSRDPR